MQAMEHNSLGDSKVETLDITNKETCEVAEYVMEWMSKNM